MDTHPSISVAIKTIGSLSALARSIGVKPPTVHQWQTGRRPIPAERCPDIERATGGAVRCEDLRPDVDWATVRANLAAPEKAV
ncbi:helix-turn-helix domain-containing protein [Zoogloea sp.]|uniref:transcriptional regulator n=1 Tax=Zoogloea sp. TaxID=49181 RepID=UPI002627FFA6|nr:helix-turn-helix domain-containing protein [Zoogloea sp.]MDD3355270.1 helix-turn-helix domain-containing protein [Zoogloea sp.]